MKVITRLIIGSHEFILAHTGTADFAKLGKFVAIRAEDVDAEGRTTRPLTGLDVLLSDTLDGLARHCLRFAKHADYMKAYPMPAFDPENPSKEFVAWVQEDFKAWRAHVLQATH